jgi:TfoX/Sxy family transcriptional regulator of competence genes
MATDRDFVEYVHEQTGLAGELAYRKMFGEYGLYFDGRIVALAADNRLFLKPTDAGRALLPVVVEAPPYPEAKNWYVIDEYLDDSELLQRLIRATAAALPAPKPRIPRQPKAGRTTKKAVGKTPAAKRAGKPKPRRK